MGIWSRSGDGGGWFCSDWGGVKAAADDGPGLASVAESLIEE
jgi:hypothetical protein